MITIDGKLILGVLLIKYTAPKYKILKQYNYAFEYLDMFNKMPVIDIKTKSELPPELIKGSGMPVLGIVFVVTDTFITTCIATKKTMPDASKQENKSGEFIAIFIPLHI